MALSDSRTALEDLAIVSKDEYKETTKIIRNGLSGIGANHSSEEEMLHGFRYGMWIKTFENIPIILENFSRLPHITDYTINKRGDRILHMAVSCGQTEAIEALLNRFPSLTVNQRNNQGETPLLCACHAGQSRIVLWLTTHGATALIGAWNGESPLHLLISFDDEEVERVYPGLIQPGADTTAKTLTIIAYQADFPAAAVPDRLLRGYAIGWATHCDRPQIVPFLYFAVSLARDELVDYLVKQGADVIKARTDHDEELIESQDVGSFKRADIDRESGVDMRTPLPEAHGAQATKVSKNPFSGQDSTWTALHILAYARQDATWPVEQLLDHGAALDGLPDHFHTTESPLLIVVQNDAFHLADSLVSHGADLNFTTLSCSHLTLSNPTTILGHVIASNARNSIARLRYLLGSPSIDGLHLIVEPARQRSALHRAAAAHIDVEFHGTDAAEAAELHWADVDWSANREIMNEILRHFNGPEQLNAVETSTGLSPMRLAVLAGNEAAVSLLLDHGARSDVPSVGGQGATAADTALGIQMGGLSMIEEIGRPGREEVAARKQCSNLLNPATQSAAQAQPSLA
ncbi:related to death-associated protein kinase 1 [Fusarium oxysporum]|uniref:Related to death-associated protein kinase 1 n=1 Tax=Fusarium oxysporum TaxID=5507 RepID=A0A2H3TK22_FUSOX|nr:related to death-associated protein kinase 1 [Fusarium oxysporum]